MKISANNLQIKIEDSAPDAASDSEPLPVVLLIMGLGMQLIAWPPGFVRGLTNAGFRVVRFDNRDSGLSDHLHHHGKPNVMWQSLKYKLGLKIKPPYSLDDMALDALGVLDALQIDTAHVVGVSMGGMVAQRVALAAPQRVATLTSIMSSSGARGLPAAAPAVMRQMFSQPGARPGETAEQAAVEHSVKFFQLIGSPAFPPDVAYLRDRVTMSTQRSHNPHGLLRQMVAVAADSKRADQLQTLNVPTLVLHGKADPLVPFACGEDTARRIPGAHLVGIDGMGHDLPPPVVELLLAQLVPFIKSPSHYRPVAI
jgi:pimeloyl-ACP methyl ester carboxylesterase